MKRYIFLYNVDGDYFEDINMQKLKRAGVDYVTRDYSITWGEVGDGSSIWVLEEHYLMAWTIWNCNELLKITFVEELDEDDEFSVNDGVRWFERCRKETMKVVEVEGH